MRPTEGYRTYFANTVAMIFGCQLLVSSAPKLSSRLFDDVPWSRTE